MPSASKNADDDLLILKICKCWSRCKVRQKHKKSPSTFYWRLDIFQLFCSFTKKAWNSIQHEKNDFGYISISELPTRKTVTRPIFMLMSISSEFVLHRIELHIILTYYITHSIPNAAQKIQEWIYHMIHTIKMRLQNYTYHKKWLV